MPRIQTWFLGRSVSSIFGYDAVYIDRYYNSVFIFRIAFGLKYLYITLYGVISENSVLLRHQRHEYYKPLVQIRL